jgi:hypothetical protein
MVCGPLHPPAEPAEGFALRRLTADSTLRALRRTSPPTVAVANRGTSQIDGCEIFSWCECLSELVVNVNQSFLPSHTISHWPFATMKFHRAWLESNTRGICGRWGLHDI